MAALIEAHQFRIDTEGEIGRPIPEGAQRDGVDLVAVFLVDRQGIKRRDSGFRGAGPPLTYRAGGFPGG